MKSKINQAGVNALYARIGSKIEDADRRIRTAYTGRSAAEIEPAARAAFQAINLNLSSNNIAAYARSVEKNEPFKIHLS